MRSLTLSQCRDLRIGVTWPNLGALTTARARKFWITWRRSDDGAWFSRLYVIRSGNGAGLYLQPRSPHGATQNNLVTLVYTETDNTWLLLRKQKLMQLLTKIMTPIQYKRHFYQIVEWNQIEQSIRHRESNRIDFFHESPPKFAQPMVLFMKLSTYKSVHLYSASSRSRLYATWVNSKQVGREIVHLKGGGALSAPPAGSGSEPPAAEFEFGAF